jgi:nucleotide-binding universal stress UspA family protein
MMLADHSRGGAMKILVPFRGEFVPRAAFPEAGRLARVLDSDVVLVAVGYRPEGRARRKDGKRDLEQEAGNPTRESDGRVRERIEPAGDPVRGIVHAAREEEADMILLLSGGLVASEGQDEDDLAEQVSRESGIPVRLIGREGSD